ncbi:MULTISPECIES: helicase-related protein [unclassified Microcystis]|uniref:helicase-related protein n=1 Tax=unclassified Microcystis TaxID=2643300 RepID=UPI0022BA8183|nr:MULTISPECIES: helicase-related protein [unclassified Microcystis]MCA2692954.1 NgoFVII family restriction endonuclease [Microcystis sp. M034S2]MCA2750964.1 NgoFVII family restriction endonuclease [Microcystis sp. M144S2]MCZ8200544.1 helicase-related protein [Microcystis sp. LE19-55.1A]MCZ8307959.1 helicase-related protein [Microcystis sp. LE19-98.1E]
MPRIIDNIESHLLPILRESLLASQRADFCVGYFNLRGWQSIDTYIDHFLGGDLSCCRLLIGMQQAPQELLQQSLSLLKRSNDIDKATCARLRKQIVQDFCQQLTWGNPSNRDQAALQRLAKQIQSGKLVIRLFLGYNLHAKLYLIHRQDVNNPTVGFLGSSNLTFAGLQQQGELNIDVLDHDACAKLQKWFNDRWFDAWCWDISEDIVKVINESWARESLIPPYHIYLKIAYHLSFEARAGLAEYKIPRQFDQDLLDFQKSAIKIAARYVQRRGGVLIGDVVGLGKTRIASILAYILQEDYDLEILIICPKNLLTMWEDYSYKYKLRAKIIPLSQVMQELPNLRRYRVVIIDESHNLRNREGKRYRVIQEYINTNESRCILLTATPYNKNYRDLSNQLRLFIQEDTNLGIRPERLLESLGGEIEFNRRYQSPVRSLAAFEKSDSPDDWRDLMRLYMIRRTRGFIKNNYATEDEQGRRYLKFADGSRVYLPQRQLKTIKFDLQDSVYARLYSEAVVITLNGLKLPRYGLGNYLIKGCKGTGEEETILKSLSRAGKRLMGFCRTNLFKRLESGGYAFLQSLDRHILRNYIFLHAMANNLPLPIGSQDPALLDTRYLDEDLVTQGEDESIETEETGGITGLEKEYQKRAEQVYQKYSGDYRKRFQWINPEVFKPALKKDLKSDALALIALLQTCGTWQPETDEKLEKLWQLLEENHPREKVLIFSQFADTVSYLVTQLQNRGVDKIAGVTGNSANPAEMVHRFSPRSNSQQVGEEIRVLVATDILSEGLNLQDCAIIVNYDLPWAIIRLIQRAGRVDRIGQKASQILCYSFLPAEGVERIIKLRTRLSQRLRENADVVGTDEVFFEEEMDNQTLLDLYHEKSEVIDEEEDQEVDLTSEAYQIWKNAIEVDPSLKHTIETLPPVVYSTRCHSGTATHPEGVMVYLKTAGGNDALAWIDKQGNSVTQSQLTILRSAACHPQTPAIPPHPQHHQLVQKGTELIAEEENNSGSKLGRLTGAKFKTYERLKRYSQDSKDDLFAHEDLCKALDQLYHYPLRQSALDRLNRGLRTGISDRQLADLLVSLYKDNDLCIVHPQESTQEPQIICSLGLFQPS